MSTLKSVFPNLTVSKDDVVFTFCGVRPLPASGMDYTSRVSRSHRLDILEPDAERSFAIYSMIGGKPDKILAELGKMRNVSTLERTYLGAKGYPADESAKQNWIDRVAGANGLACEHVADLLNRYGAMAEEIASRQDSAKRAPLVSLSDYSIAEIEYIAENECIRHLSDLVRRRSIITILGRAGEAALKELADIVGGVLGWDRQRQEAEVQMALKEATDGR